jgi:hypothetical protein
MTANRPTECSQEQYSSSAGHVNLLHGLMCILPYFFGKLDNTHDGFYGVTGRLSEEEGPRLAQPFQEV